MTATRTTGLACGTDCVDLWQIRLDDHCGDAEALVRVLDGEERRRAGRRRDRVEQERFIVRRALRRVILSFYVGQKPEEVSFGAEVRGKPFLAEGAERSGLRFSTSHCRGWGLVAVAFGREIGVDLEYVDPACDIEAAVQLFSPREREAFAHEPAGSRRLAFFRCWTRKEAWVKAVGCGLSAPLDSFTVPCGAPRVAGRRVTGLDAGTGRVWRLTDVEVAGPFVACVAVEGRSQCGIRTRRFGR